MAEPQKVFTGVGELADAVGTYLGSSSWQTIDQERIDAFAAITGDAQWIHVDPDRSARGPFGRTIAHGFLTLSLVSSFMDEVFRIDGVPMVVNYGLNRLRFPAPVAVGSRVRGRVDLVDLAQGPSGYFLHSTVTVEIDGNDKPACVADTITYLPLRAEEA